MNLTQHTPGVRKSWFGLGWTLFDFAFALNISDRQQFLKLDIDNLSESKVQFLNDFIHLKK